MNDETEGLGASYAQEVAADEAAKRPTPPPQQEGAQAATGGASAEQGTVDFDLSTAEAAALGWEILDLLVCKYAGSDMALTDAEKVKLVKPTVRLLEKYGAAVKLSPEWALAGTAAVIYGAKLAESGALPLPFMKNAAAASSSTPPQSTTTTTANVDGKPVAAEVVHFPKGQAAS